MSLRLQTDPLSPEALEIARTELRETPEVVQQSLAELRELLQNDDNIYFKDDDDTLTIFLRPCKWYAKSAYELMKRVADFKEKYRDILTNLTPEVEKSAITEHNVVNALKDRDHKGRRILVVNAGATWDPSKVTSNQVFRLFFLIQELAILEPETQVRGVVVIMDYKDLGMKQVRALNPSFSLLLLSFIQDAMPLRLKEIHMINEPFIFNMVWNIFKPFIRKKLKGRIFFHGSKMDSLHKHLDPAYIPSNYGGKLPAIDYSGIDWYPIMQANLDHIETYNSFGKKK